MRNLPNRLRDPFARGRALFIIEAALEYFISILLTDAFLASVTTRLGMSSATTGVLSSFVSLGCVFQLANILVADRRPVRRWLPWVSIFASCLYALLYFLPGFALEDGLRTGLFAVFLLTGRFIANLLAPSKIAWQMNLVAQHERGVYTANKEIVSLIGGTAFTFAASAFLDRCRERGDVSLAFPVLGGVILLLAVLNTATLLMTPEPAGETLSRRGGLAELKRNPVARRLILVSVLSSLAEYVTVPFLGVYKIRELGFSMTFISLLTLGQSLFRALVSRRMGRFADKMGFRNMLMLCYGVEAAAFLCVAFAVPQNGKIMFVLFSLLHGLAYAGINSGSINLLYDYIPRGKCPAVLAVKATAAGLCGFLATVAASRFVDHIENAGNMLLGMHVYAQQAAACISVFVVLTLIWVLKTLNPPAASDIISTDSKE